MFCQSIIFFIIFNIKAQEMLVLDQVQNSFRRTRQDVDVEVVLGKENGTHLLLIQLTYLIKRVKYNMQIDRSYIQRQGESFIMTIKSVEELFEVLREDFDQLVITEDGCIHFELKFISRSQVSSKIYRFQGKKEEIPQETHQQIRIKQLEEQLRERDEKINQISIYYQEVLSQKQRLQTKFEELNRTNQLLIDNLSLLHQQMAGLKQQLSKAKASLYVDNISTIKSQSPSKSYLSHGGQLSSHIHLKSVFNNFPLRLHPDSLNGEFFKTEKRSNSLTITKKKDNFAFDNYVCIEPLPEGKTSTFRMKQIRTQDKDVFFGIGCASVINKQNAHTCKQTVSYYSSDGSIFVNSQPQSGGEPLCDGHKLLMLADLVNWNIEWIIDGTRTASILIPEAMRAQRLYVFVMMAYEGDTVMLTV